MDSQTIRNTLQCSICLELLKQPKLLKCSHTFCQVCLEQCFKSARRGNSITCPICRENTAVPYSTVSSLPTNIPVAQLLTVFKETKKLCDICPSGEAITYCLDCRVFMCKACLADHTRWKLNSGHKLFKMKILKEGNFSNEKALICGEHSQGHEVIASDLCLDCRKQICQQCCEHHTQEGHRIVGIDAYALSKRTQQELLKTRTRTKLDQLKQQKDFISGEEKKVKTHMDLRRSEVNLAYRTMISRLEQEKMALIRKCDDLERAYRAGLEKHRSKISIVESELENALALSMIDANRKTCHEKSGIPSIVFADQLKTALSLEHPATQDVEEITGRAEKLSFKQKADKEGIHLGDVGIFSWSLRCSVDYTGKNMNCMVSTKKKEVVVGFHDGGIKMFSRDGTECESTLEKLQIIQIIGLAVLSDGTFVSRDVNNVIHVHKNEAAKRSFQTLNQATGGFGGLTADEFDRIIISYRTVKKIQIFEPDGGKAVKEVSCPGFIPEQIFAMTGSKILIVDISTIRIINHNGDILQEIKTVNHLGYPTMCNDGNVIIAWVNHVKEIVDIVRYTPKLVPLEPLVREQKIKIPSRKWFSLQIFPSGNEIAFSTPNYLHIFTREESFPLSH